MGYMSFMIWYDDGLMTRYPERDLSWFDIRNCVFMIEGLCSIYKQNSVEFSVEILMLELNLISCFYIGHQVSVFKQA